jgi:hypothetical protein
MSMAGRNASSCPTGPTPVTANVFPLKVGELLAERRRRESELVEVRVYRGRPNPERQPGAARANDRQADMWERSDRVTVSRRNLRLTSSVGLRLRGLSDGGASLPRRFRGTGPSRAPRPARPIRALVTYPSSSVTYARTNHVSTVAACRWPDFATSPSIAHTAWTWTLPSTTSPVPVSSAGWS